MDRNLELYRHYQAARNLVLWLPVFFLYFGTYLPIDRVLALEAIYYAGVVALEVPTGYFSDRIGRRPTLVLASACWVGACIVFAATHTFAAFAVAQLLLAAGMALASGTDGSLLYDTLAALGREHEFAEYEGRAQARARIALGVAALLGGSVAAIDLRFAYLGSAISAAVAMAIAIRFVEPPDRPPADPIVPQLRAVLGRLREPVLAWTFAVAVAMTVFNHVPYELAQPYLRVVLEAHGRGGLAEPLAGVLTAVAMTLAAIVSVRAGRLAANGVRNPLIAAMLLQLVVVAAIGAWASPLVIVIIALRGIPGAIEGPLVQAASHPRLASKLRATYLSVQSLAGRLAFAGGLALASGVVGETTTIADPAAIATLARGAAIALAVVIVILFATSSGRARA